MLLSSRLLPPDDVFGIRESYMSSQAIMFGFSPGWHPGDDSLLMVSEGYSAGAVPYRRAKDESLLRLPILSQWVEIVLQMRPQADFRNTSPISSQPPSPVLDLGCGPGFPLAGHISGAIQERSMGTIIYKGVDLSHAMVEMARQEYPDLSDRFEVCEMLEYCKRQADHSVSGVIAISSVYHLPRSKHVELFAELYRVLKRGAPLLFTVPLGSQEGYSDDWLGAGIKMFWSYFSPSWYELTLGELGFEQLTKFKEDKVFLGERETTWFLLFRVPDDSPVSLSSFT